MRVKEQPADAAMYLPRTAIFVLSQLSIGATGYTFGSRAELLSARDSLCADVATAEATYGPVHQWNISAVTDLSYLFCSRYPYQHARFVDCNPDCKNFNHPGIGSWDTSNVVTLEVTNCLLASSPRCNMHRASGVHGEMHAMRSHSQSHPCRCHFSLLLALP